MNSNWFLGKLKQIDEESDSMTKSINDIDLTLRLGTSNSNKVNARNKHVEYLRKPRGNYLGPIRSPMIDPALAPYHLPNLTVPNYSYQNVPNHGGLMRHDNLEETTPYVAERIGALRNGGANESHYYPIPNPAGYGSGLANIPASSSAASPSSASYYYNNENSSYTHFPAAPRPRAPIMNNINGFRWIEKSSARQYLQEVMAGVVIDAPLSSNNDASHNGYMYNGMDFTVRRRTSSINVPALDSVKRCSNYNCNSVDTPMWRRGPLGPKTLCNACGIKYRKEEEKRKERMVGAVAGKSRTNRPRQPAAF